ncbi:hypothetical protein OSB04_025115 [Centaurea solstitialis]|uniref:Zinc finger MYM-type protein 1-like n=1 Tax=Centaurea solstitialis TaxID=347529 RepID=A0AA38T6X4_9ASTR|nr:hypothetical protein OSB04_025115 [Centaurea solstitialis]
MDKFLTKRKNPVDSEPINIGNSKRSCVNTEINLADLPADPGMRIRILDCNPNIRDEVRRSYLLKGPYNHETTNSLTLFLEGNNEDLTPLGLMNILLRWNTFAHNQAWSNCVALLTNKQHIENVIIKHSDQSKIDYKIRLSASIDCVRFLLRQGLAFRGHDEGETSKNRGKFIELLQFFADHNNNIEAVTFKNAPENHKLTSSDIQKDIVNTAAIETTKLIVNDLGDDFFSVLVDESRDVSIKEQMGVVVRYVDTKGCIILRFLGIEHVPNTTSISLKAALDDLFSRQGLSISNLHGQGYDGASNMQGELDGLKTLNLNENSSAYYVHCFAHQLQLTLVAVAKKHLKIASLFLLLINVVNVVGGSCKRRDRLREQQASKVIEALDLDEISSGRGLNQETSLSSIANFLKRKLNDGSHESGGGSSKRDGYNNEIPQRPQPSSTLPSPFASVPTTIDLNDLPSDPADRPKITTYHPNQREEIRRAYWIKGPCQPKGQQGGKEAFVTEGFSTWSKKKSLYTHMGNIDSYHNKARQKCENLVKKNQSISVALHKQTELEKSSYEIRLRATISTCRFLLKNKLAFRGHDESGDSISRGLFIETLSLLREHNESIYNVTLDKAPKNDKLTSPKIQKDIIKCFSQEIMKSICDEIGKDVFAVLVDESSDVSKKEQMAIVLRYVDSLGIVKERFVGVVHVTNTSSLTLKAAIDTVFSDNKLSMDQVRGQSNMRGEFNGLKTLILKDNKSAHYVHCFAHQLQLVVVAVAKNHDGAHDFFEHLALVVNVGETETGRGLNQELSLIRAGDTRWGSHYKTIISLMNLFPEVVEVLKYVEEDGSTLSNRNQAYGILSYFKTFDFVFYLHLMLEILGLTNTLSRHLQRKDQDILEAASLVRGTKKSLQTLRNDGFNSILKKVCSFCQKHNIEALDMTEYYVTPRNRRTKITNQHHFEVEIFNTVLDMQIQEFGDRFSEVSTELLENMAALSPCDSFSKFDKSKLLKLSEMYPNDFSDSERMYLSGQLEIYHHSLLQDDRFANLNGIADLSRLMVETGKHRSFPLVYKLLKLVLVLPVATATVERCFSAMKLLKTDLHNKMSDDFMNHALICAVEKEALLDVKIESVMNRFQKMKERKDVLEMIEEDGLTQEQKCEALQLSTSLQSFDFVCCMHLMKTLLGITNELSQALQRKEQDIINAMNLVGVCKKQLQTLRDSGLGFYAQSSYFVL